MSEVVFKLHLNIEVKTFRSLVLNSGKIAIKCLIGQTFYSHLSSIKHLWINCFNRSFLLYDKLETTGIYKIN